MKTTHNMQRTIALAGSALGAMALVLMAGTAQAQAASDLLPAKYREAGVIKLVTDAKYPPFQSIDDSGNMVGFEVDLWDAMAERLGVELEVTSVAFDSLIPGVQSGRWDVAMEGITDNAERQEVVSFVDYGYTTSSAYVLEDKSEGVNDHLDLCGLNGAAQIGTEWVGFITAELAEACVAAGKPAPSVSEFGTSDATLLSLYSARTDFVLTSAASAQEIMKAAPRAVTVVPMPVLPRKPSGIAFRKDETDLGQALLAALKEVRADGTYERIYSEWSVQPMMMDHEPGINLETVPSE
ncbi:ABC transporter substrate-binding protein [Paracoccus sp. Z118]|uniref:ABC transporter substrate-binding protein n=1 Tax=Paracoccus sp. Z118 TaxID=2851017 RepID=UPI001C2CA2D6|nr:ABC transporter substrate-binding protein [Paracoccus sp. Z118]MBV0893077.1 ABC transporter substrate-binding protein [Paracoccus sp. Z118]